MLAGIVDLERARIEERLGHGEAAKGHYRRFLQRYDRAGRWHLALVNEATARGR